MTTLQRPFLTDLDTRAAVKGSRDPLGIVPLWSAFGRQVVGNLTTVTGSVRGFTTLLLGYHFARAARERQGASAETPLGFYLRFEQLATYCRYHVHGDDEFRGIERVRRALADAQSIRLSTRAEDQILSNQRVYGTWGLFSSAARASGLLEPGEPVLGDAAQRFVESEYLARLTRSGLRDGGPIVDLLRQPRPAVHLDGQHAGLARALAALFTPAFSAAERRFYREHLLFGGPADTTAGRQRQLAERMPALRTSPGFDRRQLRALIKETSKAAALAPLAERLAHIDTLESLLVPAGAAFGQALAGHGRPLRDVAADLRRKWGRRLACVDADAVARLRVEIGNALHDDDAGEHWSALAVTLAQGDYADALTRLLEHNARLMRQRNGSDAWARLTAGKLDVRFKDERTLLPVQAELPHLWWNNYFLDPLKAVAVQVGGA